MNAPAFFGDVRPEHLEWITTADGKRLRAAHWGKGEKGTIILFSGRTEFLEKYCETAQEFAARGWGMAAVDWRGQGLSQRLLRDSEIGHVTDFTEYQRDVTAFLQFCTDCNLPKPWVMFAHSMGGAIGLRALHNGFQPAAAIFSAPMWDITLRPALRVLATMSYHISKPLGLSTRYAPTQGPYVAMAFDGNPLTHDRARLDGLAEQVSRDPLLALGGPSIAWVYHALRECRALARLKAPQNIPVLAFVGTDERIVSRAQITSNLAKWPGAEIVEIKGAAHEILMETDPMRDQALQTIDRFLAKLFS